MANFDFEQFQWFLPKPKNPCAITIRDQGKLTLNAKFLEEAPLQFTVGVSQDGRRLCIREHADGFKRLSSGAVKDSRIIQQILSKGIRLPARYVATRQADVWVAELETAEQPSLNLKKPPKKPRTKGLSGVLAELEGV